MRDSASVVSPIEFTTGTAGIGLAPAFVVGKDLAKGRLVLLMPDYKPVESELSAIYPPGKKPVSQGAEPDRLSCRALWTRAALG